MDASANQDNESELLENLALSLTGSFLGSGYQSINALLIYWQANDLGFQTEVSALQKFLTDEYNVHNTVFAIPSERSEQALRKALTEFTYERALPGTLALLYYGGHGDPDETTRKSIWAAKGSGPPTLDWSRIQPSVVENTDSDVLIILDCCYAAQAARGRGSNKVELLAASGMGCRTPGVGAFSFTSALINQMRFMSSISDSHFTVSQLHTRMSKADVGLQATPVLFNLSGSGESIRIPSKLVGPKPVKEGEAYYCFTVTVTDRPTKHQIAQISDWLKTAAPRSISDVSINKILLKSQRLRQITETNPSKGSRATFFERIPAASQDEVTQALNGIDQHIMDSTFLASLPKSNSSKAESFVTELDKRISYGLEVLEEAALAMSSKDLKEFEEVELARNLGLSDGASMLLSNMGERQLSPPKLPGEVKFTSPSPASTHFASGSLSSEAVIVEYIYYQESQQGGPPSDITSQLDKISALLSEADPYKFHVLPCIGVFHDPEFTRHGLVYRQTMKHDFAILSSKYEIDPRLALGHRFALAYALAVSVLHFHSDDYTSPRIFGFNYSRTDVDLSKMSADFVLDRNIYRHPDRWGVPSKKFSKVYDLYGLGVILLEIGFWRLAKKTDQYEFSLVKKPTEVRNRLIKLAKERLPYHMGKPYTAATLACLTGDAFDGISSDPIDQNRWEWQKKFKEVVLAPLTSVKSL